jgi:hypothetical protein
VQRLKLKNLLRQVAAARIQPAWQGDIPSWESFRQAYPVTRYADWQKAIRDQRQGRENLTSSPIVRYQPTSGSSEKLKMIPYTRAFLKELDGAIGPWLASMYRRHPGLKGGAHYWSVSWLPQNQYEDLRGNLNDDSELMGGAKRWLASHAQAVSPDVALASSPGDAMFASLCYLVARSDLRMLSVWSPTFALQLLDSCCRCGGEEIQRVLVSGSWGARQTALASLKAPRNPAGSRQAAGSHAMQELSACTRRACCGRIWRWCRPGIRRMLRPGPGNCASVCRNPRFEGKGLWATEGVVTIPVDGFYPLAYQSHVYEFEDLRYGRQFSRPGSCGRATRSARSFPAVTALLRYQLDDRMVVSELVGRKCRASASWGVGTGSIWWVRRCRRKPPARRCRMWPRVMAWSR